MSMEHRWSQRKPITMDVTLHYEPIGQIKGTTHDVSLEGMFVDICGVPLPERAELEVSFETANHGHTQRHRVPAYVVHGRNNGVGLMLRHVGYNDFNALRYMLNAA